MNYRLEIEKLVIAFLQYPAARYIFAFHPLGLMREDVLRPTTGRLG